MSNYTLQVGVKIFLQNSEGKYLLLKRSSEKYKTKGSWDIPGGRINPGSDLIENLRREVKEETNLEIISEPKILAAQDIFVPDREGHVVRISYSGETEGELVLDTTENVEYKWLSLDEIKSQPDLDIYVKEILYKNLLTN